MKKLTHIFLLVSLVSLAFASNVLAKIPLDLQILNEYEFFSVGKSSVEQLNLEIDSRIPVVFSPTRNLSVVSFTLTPSGSIASCIESGEVKELSTKFYDRNFFFQSKIPGIGGV